MMTNKDKQDNEGHTDFGFQSIRLSEKQGLVNKVFSGVADRYDLMNDLMSGGLHRLWKHELINWLQPPKTAEPYHLIDVAGGTGDIAIRFLNAAGEGARATICDINPQMLMAGRKKLGQSNLTDRVILLSGNAEALPFANQSFDAYTIAFGIRNVPRIERALSEAFRVLKIGGRFLCLEFSEVQVPLLDTIYDSYSFHAIPMLGAVAAGDEMPYRYLIESIRRFPDQDKFASLVEAAGFGLVKYRNLSGGIAAIHSGWKL